MNRLGTTVLHPLSLLCTSGLSPCAILLLNGIPSDQCCVAVAVLTLFFTGLISPAARAADPPERLTPEQRKELERDSGELTRSVTQLYQRGAIPDLPSEKPERHSRSANDSIPRASTRTVTPTWPIACPGWVTCLRI